MSAKKGMKAIETRYHGYRMRSRTEARTAVMLDALGLTWDYEPEGVTYGGICYLPDFYLPELVGVSMPADEPGVWIEIKGTKPSPQEEEKAAMLAIGSGHPVFIFFGTPDLPTDRHHAYGYFPFTGGARHPSWFAWTECPNCLTIGICPKGETMWLPCPCAPDIAGTFNDETLEDTRHAVQGMDGDRIVQAIAAARSARFEHGESPK